MREALYMAIMVALLLLTVFLVWPR